MEKVLDEYQCAQRTPERELLDHIHMKIRRDSSLLSSMDIYSLAKMNPASRPDNLGLQ